MTRNITDRQLKYLNILLSDAVGEGGRSVYLSEEYNVDSSKDLTVQEASEIISKFVPDNDEREKNVDKAQRIVAKATGQQEMF